MEPHSTRVEWRFVLEDSGVRCVVTSAGTTPMQLSCVDSSTFPHDVCGKYVYIHVHACIYMCTYQMVICMCIHVYIYIYVPVYIYV